MVSNLDSFSYATFVVTGKDETKTGAAAWMFTSIAKDDGEFRVALNYAKRSLLVEAYTLKLLGLRAV